MLVLVHLPKAEHFAQYCIILRNGNNKGIKHYFWVPKFAIQRIFDKPSLNLKYPKHGVYLGHISGCKGDEVEYNNKRTGSLEIRAGTKESANKCAEYLKLPAHIIKKKPSAELTVGQTDEADLGASYTKLDKILQKVLSDEKLNKKDNLIKKTLQRMEKHKHKRTSPPILELQ